MNKIYNVILVILIVLAIIVGGMIFKKYYNNHLNEIDVSETITEIETELNKVKDDEVIEKTYKGYEVAGIIEIPKINIKYPIINETNDDAMKVSITKFYGPKVNEIGNCVFAGHNNRDGTMFGKVRHLEIGDTIKLTNLKNQTIEYEVFKIYNIDPNDLSILDIIEEGTRELTLITCTNGHKERLITKAREIL